MHHSIAPPPRASRWWLLPGGLLGLLIVAAALAPWIAPQNPYDLAALRLEDSAHPPTWHTAAAPRYPLGADIQGRDVLSASIYGLRVSLVVGLAGTTLAMVFGVALGLAAGWRRGWIDALIMRAADIQLSFPTVLIALFLMAVWGRGLGKIVVAVAIAHWVIYARTVRGATLAERRKDYIAAIRALGASTPRIVWQHLLPNLASPILVISAVEFASVVMLEATLSFLGMGAPITRPSLGLLIKFGYDEVYSGCWWIWLFPGLALVALVASLNALADLLRARLMTKPG